MAANQNVIDELVVKLTLDASEYKKADKATSQLVDTTEKKLQTVDAKRKKRENEQQKRNREALKSVKELTIGFKALALTVGGLLGVGGGGGLVASVVALAGMETNLRRTAVSTGLSNRELQAWGASVRRLGGDAQAGAQAVADLAKEQQQFSLTGQGPTLQAFASLGVRIGPKTPVADLLGQAQEIYRAAPEPQKQQYENVLSARGVSADLILAIKSEKNVRDEFAKSYAESASENRKALDAVTDGLAALNNAAASVANSIATVLQPYIEQFATFVSNGAREMSGFVDRVVAAGGGVDGFLHVLNSESPQIAAALNVLGKGLTVFAQTVDVATYGLKLIAGALRFTFDWLDRKLSFLTGGNGKTTPLKDAVGVVGDAVKDAWQTALAAARTDGVTHLSDAATPARLTPARPRASTPAITKQSTNRSATGGADAARRIMYKLTSQYGFSVAEAAGIVANIEGESTFNPAAYNPNGGGNGARGLFQWRGERSRKFRQMTGVEPNHATEDEQLRFFATDPYERRMAALALRGSNSAASAGARFSRIFEAHNERALDAKRGLRAQEFANSFASAQNDSTPSVGQQFNIQNVTVQANSPQELASGLQRQTGVQNYNSAVR